jgi:hypothetical protein
MLSAAPLKVMMAFCRTDQKPLQLGPTTATPCVLAASANCRAFSWPPSTSSKPALNTTALRMPFWPHSAITPATVCAGVITSATSGTSGSSATVL